ncbi:MAG: MBL fold metallo-hydrolase [Endomicrobium sp.]|jgi:glyoxylase-like metal-dependent hydrolase (beta-lactamase superfamily II)|nr:MBL fold metallo-hydrolase [Endomicrobium sp.]
MVKVKKIISGVLAVNCYLIYDSETKKALVADPGEDGGKIISEIEKENLLPEMLVNTHGHFDHILSDEQIRNKYNIPLAVHKGDAAMITDPSQNGSYAFFEREFSIKEPDITLSDNQTVELSFTKFKVMHTPGHTEGGICLLFDGFALTGDTLFAGTIGRTDFPNSDHKKMLDSLEKLKKLNPKTVVYPGHGSITTIANELRHNPFLKSKECG